MVGDLHENAEMLPPAPEVESKKNLICNKVQFTFFYNNI